MLSVDLIVEIPSGICVVLIANITLMDGCQVCDAATGSG